METSIRRRMIAIGRRAVRLAVPPLLVAVGALAGAPPASAATEYLYTTFRGDAAADQELWVYRSTDATTFGVLADTNYRGPTGVLRDPSIVRHNGRYYVAHTVQSWTTNSTHFNIASSTDLVTWTHVASVASGIADTRFVWAPEFFVEGSTVQLKMHDDDIVGVDLPAAVELKIAQTEPGIQGDRVSGARKPATLETGLVIQVPLFVDMDDSVKVDTRTGEYITRA